jgi:hypothetical protein
VLAYDITMLFTTIKSFTDLIKKCLTAGAADGAERADLRLPNLNLEHGVFKRTSLLQYSYKLRM